MPKRPKVEIEEAELAPNEEFISDDDIDIEVVVTEEEGDQTAVSDEIQQEEGVPLIQSVKQFNSLPVKLQGILQATLAQQNSKREADGEPELPLDRFLRTSTARNTISKFFKDPANAADVTAYNDKKAPAKPAEAPEEEMVIEETDLTGDQLESLIALIDEANSIEELNILQEEFANSDLIEDIDNIDAVKEAVASRKQELTKSVKYDNIKVGDVLVFGDNKYGLVEKVTTTKLTVVPLYGERLTPAKDANKRVTVLKKDFSKMVQSVYDTQANVVLGTNDVPSPTAEEKDLINKNVDLQNDFLTDKKAREIARLKDADRSANDVTDEFSNKLGC
jgi:hypothetical protein